MSKVQTNVSPITPKELMLMSETSSHNSAFPLEPSIYWIEVTVDSERSQIPEKVSNFLLKALMHIGSSPLSWLCQSWSLSSWSQPKLHRVQSPISTTLLIILSWEYFAQCFFALDIIFSSLGPVIWLSKYKLWNQSMDFGNVLQVFSAVAIKPILPISISYFNGEKWYSRWMPCLQLQLLAHCFGSHRIRW